MADLFDSFETGFAQPSLDNPILFGIYADEIAARLRQQYPAHSGYSIGVQKKEGDPKRREWYVDLQRGWSSGVRVRISPLRQTPHRARVRIAWRSKLMDVMEKGFTYISLIPMFLLFLAFAWKTRLGFALILTIVIGAGWAIVGSIAIMIVARIFAAMAGNEFTSDTCAALANKIEQFPLPQSTSAKS